MRQRPTPFDAFHSIRCRAKPLDKETESSVRLISPRTGPLSDLPQMMPPQHRFSAYRFDATTNPSATDPSPTKRHHKASRRTSAISTDRLCSPGSPHRRPQPFQTGQQYLWPPRGGSRPPRSREAPPRHRPPLRPCRTDRREEFLRVKHKGRNGIDIIPHPHSVVVEQMKKAG